MNTLELMKLFTVVCQQKSFVKASQELNVSAPVITRGIAQLESHLGVTLFTRTTRRIALTDSGEIYRQECERILADIAQAEEVVSGSYAQPKGILHVTAPVMFGRLHVLPIINQFLNDHPDVDIRLLLQDAIVDMMDEHVEVAIRIGHLKDSGLYARHVGFVRRVVVASPEYLNKFGTPKTPKALEQHRIITTQWQKKYANWPFDAPPAQLPNHLHSRVVTSDIASAIQCIVAGQGIGQLLSYQVDEPIRNGLLVPLLTEFETPPLPVHIVHLEGRRANARTRRFVETATTALRANSVLLQSDKT